MIIAICGFMGAGKTSFLKMFPEVSSIDLDLFIQDGIELEIGDFIRKNGWPAFRDLESEKLELALKKLPNHGLLSLGGGTLDELDNLNLLNESNVKILHLAVEFDVAMERIKGDKNRAQLDKPINELLDLYTRREKLFKRVSHCSLPSNMEQWPTSWAVLKSFF